MRSVSAARTRIHQKQLRARRLHPTPYPPPIFVSPRQNLLLIICATGNGGLTRAVSIDSYVEPNSSAGRVSQA